jgi:hypothetical protein
MIDCDVHQNFDHVQDLVPWLDPAFRDYVVHGGYGGYSLPNYPWLHPSGFMRGDSVPPDGGVPGSDYETMRAQLLDAFDLEYAILTGEEILSVSAVPHPQLAAASRPPTTAGWSRSGSPGTPGSRARSSSPRRTPSGPRRRFARSASIRTSSR